MGPKKSQVENVRSSVCVELGGGPWPGFVWIGLVEVRDEFGSVRELRCQEPRGLFISTFVTGPLNQVLELAFAPFVYLGIED